MPCDELKPGQLLQIGHDGCVVDVVMFLYTTEDGYDMVFLNSTGSMLTMWKISVQHMLDDRVWWPASDEPERR